MGSPIKMVLEAVNIVRNTPCRVAGTRATFTHIVLMMKVMAIDNIGTNIPDTSDINWSRVNCLVILRNILKGNAIFSTNLENNPVVVSSNHPFRLNRYPTNTKANTTNILKYEANILALFSLSFSPIVARQKK